MYVTLYQTFWVSSDLSWYSSPIVSRLAQPGTSGFEDSILSTGGGSQGDRPVFIAAGTKILADFFSSAPG